MNTFELAEKLKQFLISCYVNKIDRATAWSIARMYFTKAEGVSCEQFSLASKELRQAAKDNGGFKTTI